MAEVKRMPKGHPIDPRSNVMKLGTYHPDKYILATVGPTMLVDEALIPEHRPILTQKSIGMYLRPIDRELVIVPPARSVAEYTETGLNSMLMADKASWVKKPQADAYGIFDAHMQSGLKTEIIVPTKQALFARSLQYELECVHAKREHECDGLRDPSKIRGQMPPNCRDCRLYQSQAGPTPLQLATAPDAARPRWRQHPDLQERLPPAKLVEAMRDVGAPFRTEACNWYYKNYPSKKYDLIRRKFT